jgi:hypothetical protein
MNARTDIPLGLFYDVPIEQYHASAGISNSGLNDFAQSPFHYHALHVNPLRPPREEESGQLEGSMAHCAILEPAEFPKRYVVGPNCRRGTKIWDAFEKTIQPGQTAVKVEQVETAQAQALSVRSHPEIARLLGAGRSEVSAFWIDPATGELCRCRPDHVHPVNDRSVILADVKTCGDASPREFARQVARKGYHRQAAFYTDGFQHASGLQVLGFVFIAVESKWPFAACPVMLDEDGLEKGREEYRELLQRYSECRATNTWPGYSQTIELINLPKWAA